ncbi:MFS transporter [Adlercreutzia murintestinalis]|uniref:MFS transporter n=1 Tax=Adlercreutzia murintestinalis TaxID=2941325 RepID=UPI002040439B|nr:MFS transporter [Adlercreutzia murintestinalis]
MKHRGLMFFIMYCASMCVSLSQFKIIPLLGQISEMLGITYAETSWLMSVFTVAGIILAIPAGGLVAKYGPKKVILVVMIAMICGNVMGALCIGSYPLLLISRIIEGCAFAFVCVAGIVFINMWFPDKNTGLFVGIFMTFASIASVIALNTALPLTMSLGLTSAWWVVAALSVVFTLLFVAIVKEPPAPEGAGGSAPKASILPVLSNGRVICMGVVAFVVGFVLYFFINNYPAVFGNVYLLEPTTANFYGSLNGMFGIPFCIIGGFIVDRLGLKGTPVLMLASTVLLALACFITTSLDPSIFILHTLLTAAFPGLLLTCYNYIVPFCVGNPIQIGYGIGFINVFYNIGIFVGSPAVLYAVEMGGGWPIASIVLGSVSLVGAVAVLAYMALSRKAPLPEPPGAPEGNALIQQS